MWNSKKSVDLSLLACYGFAFIMTILVAIFLFGDIGNIDENLVFNLGFLSSATFVYFALYALIRLLLNIKNGKVFVPENVTYLRRISWDCFGVAAVAVAGAFLYKDLPFTFFLLLAFIAATIGLVLRVVKNVMESAVELKVESDLTV